MAALQLIAFDADDTLWHNETLYTETKNRVIRLLERYAAAEQVTRVLDETETRNMRLYGYGAKAYTLSIIEMAISISGRQVQATEIEQILQFGKQLSTAEIHLLDGVETALKTLSSRYPLMLITKGDPLDQQGKLDRSGLAAFFQYVEIVGEKTVETYRKILDRYQVNPPGFLMIGNALRSDILPVLQLGGAAVYIPYEHTWAHELQIDQEIPAEHFHTL
ncbi:MAG: HAD family hydrolase, partial [Anaerolineaceae bacterium]|nr:HAD family hydrolase [Anaerolineaceae bacterium]